MMHSMNIDNMIPSIFQYDFMVRALIGGILAGGLAPILGTFLVLRRFSLIAETLAHVGLLGLAIGIATNLFPTITTFISVTIAAVVIERLRATGKLPGDIALAVVLYSTMAAAVVVINSVQGFNIDMWGFLFGSILTLTQTDLWFLVILALVTITVITIFYTELAMITFDDELARVSGVRVDLLNLVLAILTAGIVTLAMRILGVLLVGALIVIPFLIGQTISSGLRRSMIMGSLFGVLSTTNGLFIAFYLDISAGGAIVLSSIGFLVIAHLFKRLRSSF